MDAVKLLPEVIQRLLAVSNTDLLLHEVCALASDALGADEVSLLLIDPTAPNSSSTRWSARNCARPATS